MYKIQTRINDSANIDCELEYEDYIVDGVPVLFEDILEARTYLHKHFSQKEYFTLDVIIVNMSEDNKSKGKWL